MYQNQYQNQYQKVQKTPFVPFFLPDGMRMTIKDMIDTLQGSSQRPLVIFLVHHPFNIPDPQQYPLEFKTIRIPKSHIPDGPDFSNFKEIVYNYLRMNPNGLIGISTNRRTDLCGYFVVRWLIEERMMSIKEAIGLYTRLIPHGLTNPKYLNSISEIYDERSTTSISSVNSTASMSGFELPDSVGYDLPDDTTTAGDDSENLIPVTVTEESLRHFNRYYVLNRNEDPILTSVGVNVQPRETDQIMSDLRLLLNLQEKDFLVQPYIRFNGSVANKIQEDLHSLYMVMLEPPGRRCLLYITGPDRFLVGDNGFLKQVNLYLPEHEKRDQCLSSAILEGTLARESEDSVRTKFYITDVFLFDGDDVRNKPFDYRMGIIFNKIVKYRKEQQNKKYNTEQFEKDDLSIEIRPYLRLKYIDTIFENPSNFLNLSIDGLVFASKSPPTTRSQISFMWKSDSRDDITVQISILKPEEDDPEKNLDDENKSELDDKASKVEKEEKIVGKMYSTTAEDMVPAIVFKPVLPVLKKLDGKFIDIDIINSENRVLAVRGLSEHKSTSILENFYTMLARIQGNRYTQDDLKKDIHQIILLPRYIEEDRSKQHKKSQ